jgi:hypothetical protein
MKKVIYIMAVIVLIPMFSSCRYYIRADRPAPPPEQVEVVSPAPAAGAVWVRGHWDWVNGSYVWAPGHWRTTN